MLNWAYLKTFHEMNEQFKKRNFDKRHLARELTPIPADYTKIWITSESQPILGKQGLQDHMWSVHFQKRCTEIGVS